MKKIRGDKTSGVIIHTNMEISQENSLCSYLYLKLKCHGFFVLCFLLQNWRTAVQNKSCPGWRAAQGERRKVLRKGSRSINTVQENLYACK
jgi:hypothetical protein